MGVVGSFTDHQGLAGKIRRLEQVPQTIGPRPHSAFAFGYAAIDNVLAGTHFPFPGLHEVSGQTGAADFVAANEFVAAITARIQGGILWCVGRSLVYRPAIAALGLSLDKVCFFGGSNDAENLAAMEDGLRHPTLAAVVGELSSLSLANSRRLILASEKSGVPAIVLRPPAFRKRAEQIATGSRWRIAAAPSASADKRKWMVDLVRCRGSRSGQWLVGAGDFKSGAYAPQPRPMRASAS